MIRFETADPSAHPRHSNSRTTGVDDFQCVDLRAVASTWWWSENWSLSSLRIRSVCDVVVVVSSRDSFIHRSETANDKFFVTSRLSLSLFNQIRREREREAPSSPTALEIPNGWYVDEICASTTENERYPWMINKLCTPESLLLSRSLSLCLLAIHRRTSEASEEEKRKTVIIYTSEEKARLFVYWLNSVVFHWWRWAKRSFFSQSVSWWRSSGTRWKRNVSMLTTFSRKWWEKSSEQERQRERGDWQWIQGCCFDRSHSLRDIVEHMQWSSGIIGKPSKNRSIKAMDSLSSALSRFISNERKKKKSVKPIQLEYTNVHYRDRCESSERYRRATHVFSRRKNRVVT